MLKLISILILTIQAITPRLQTEFWAEPIPFFHENIQEQYLAPVSKYGAGHRGVDFQLAPFEAISAPATGTLAFAGKVVNRNVVTLRTTAGLASFEPACTEFEVGEQVNAKEPFAFHCPPSGDYEYHCESCVHFSARDENGYLSPLHLIEPLLPSVLKA
jgi:hypothetical protein